MKVSSDYFRPMNCVLNHFSMHSLHFAIWLAVFHQPMNEALTGVRRIDEG